MVSLHKMQVLSEIILQDFIIMEWVQHSMSSSHQQHKWESSGHLVTDTLPSNFFIGHHMMTYEVSSQASASHQFRVLYV